MTQWSEGPPQPPYAHPGAPYAVPYGPPHAARLPRETGAMVVCIVLLLLALIGSFLASAAVSGSIDNSSAAAVPPGGAYSPTGGGSAGSGGGSSSGSSVPNGSPSGTTADPQAQGKRLIRNFPLYPGAKRVASSRKYLPKGSFVSKYGVKYVVRRTPNTVYTWYLTHLSRDHLQYFGTPSTIRDRNTGKVLDSYGSITSPVTESLNGNFNIELGRDPHTSVLTVTLYA